MREWPKPWGFRVLRLQVRTKELIRKPELSLGVNADLVQVLDCASVRKPTGVPYRVSLLPRGG